jgi:hypothetical protein
MLRYPWKGGTLWASVYDRGLSRDEPGVPNHLLLDNSTRECELISSSLCSGGACHEESLAARMGRSYEVPFIAADGVLRRFCGETTADAGQAAGPVPHCTRANRTVVAAVPPCPRLGSLSLDAKLTLVDGIDVIHIAAGRNVRRDPAPAKESRCPWRRPFIACWLM